MGDSSGLNTGDADGYFAQPSPPTDTDYHHARSPRVFRLRSLHAPDYTRDPGRPLPNMPYAPAPERDQRQVTVVGVCSAGKSTLVKALRELGYNVRAVAQEHSHVPYLWQRSRPDVLIYLDASLPTIRRRRHVRWQQPVLDEEHRRLSHAREHAHLYIHTDGLSPHDVASRAYTFLNNSKQGGA